MDWLKRLRDTKAMISIHRRINRIAFGNLGDHKFCRDSIWELRIDVGPGYRIYYAIDGGNIVLLLVGGDKKSQDADIKRACEYWSDWQSRTES